MVLVFSGGPEVLRIHFSRFCPCEMVEAKKQAAERFVAEDEINLGIRPDIFPMNWQSP
jgi:hypothetical protein